mmetsp:Transcript_12238/g.24924  ORF Transcript_12238/g.24924 Transcript_12238/m.24924 type:complete len:228 (+) Transcript_12238:39-722(+)
MDVYGQLRLVGHKKPLVLDVDKRQLGEPPRPRLEEEGFKLQLSALEAVEHDLVLCPSRDVDVRIVLHFKGQPLVLLDLVLDPDRNLDTFPEACLARNIYINVEGRSLDYGGGVLDLDFGANRARERAVQALVHADPRTSPHVNALGEGHRQRPPPHLDAPQVRLHGISAGVRRDDVRDPDPSPFLQRGEVTGALIEYTFPAGSLNNLNRGTAVAAADTSLRPERDGF